MKHTIFVLAMSLLLPATVNAADIDGKYAVSVANADDVSTNTTTFSID